MVKTGWHDFGASVRGPEHCRLQIPNQDCYRLFRAHWGNLAVVSDGVGSCPTSEYGSIAACRAVRQAMEWWLNHEAEDIKILLSKVQSDWLVRILPFKPEESEATCLFAFCGLDGRIMLGMLGDGLIGVLKSDDSYMELYEKKGEAFSNQTNALSETTTPEQWRILPLKVEECQSILLCTDGVADDLVAEKREAFVRHVYEIGREFCAAKASRELRKMLENWPTPKHSDDKTLLCLYRYQETV